MPSRLTDRESRRRQGTPRAVGLGGVPIGSQTLAACESKGFDLPPRVRIEKAKAEESLASFARENPGADIPEPEWVRRAPHIAKAEAALMKAQAKMKQAQLWLDRTEISLPYDVRVTASDIDVGQFVGPADLVGRASTLGSVYRTDALQVRVPIEEDSLAYLAPAIGRSATIRTASGSYNAVVERTSAIVGPKSRLAAVFLKFAEDHPAETLPLPGSFVEVSIAGPVHDNVFLLRNRRCRTGAASGSSKAVR